MTDAEIDLSDSPALDDKFFASTELRISKNKTPGISPLQGGDWMDYHQKSHFSLLSFCGFAA